MKLELQSKLLSKFPVLLKNHYATAEEAETKIGPISIWGIECGSGWYAILDAALSELSDLDSSITVVQIKEKLGGLRIYIDCKDPETTRKAYKVLYNAEKLSYKVCESCGTSGLVREGSRIATLCDDCMRKSKSVGHDVMLHR